MLAPERASLLPRRCDVRVASDCNLIEQLQMMFRATCSLNLLTKSQHKWGLGFLFSS